MAKLIKANGEITTVTPADGVRFTLKELQGYVGGYIEKVPNLAPNAGHLHGVDMLCNEDGHSLGLEPNEVASMLAGQWLIGDILALRREEWDTPDEEEL